MHDKLASVTVGMHTHPTLRDPALQGTTRGLMKQVADWRKLHEMNQRLLVSAALEDQLSTVLTTVTSLLSGSMGVISMFDEKIGGLAIKASLGVSDAGLQQLACVALGDGVCGLSCQIRRPVFVEDTETDPLYARFRALARQEGFRAVSSMPFFGADGSSIGVVSVYGARPCRLGEHERKLMEIGVSQLGHLVERARAEVLRQDTRRALQESETRLEQLANTIPQLAWMANADGWVHWYNDRWYEYTGTTPADMEGWGWQRVHQQAVLPEVMERWRRSIATGESFEMTVPLKGKDGTFRPFLTLISPLRDSAGSVTQWVGSSTDVSPMIEAEQALRQSEGRLQQGLVAGRMTVWDWDPETGALLFSQNVEAILGCTPASMAEVFDKVHADDVESLRRALDSALLERSDFQQVCRFSRPQDSQPIWLECGGAVGGEELTSPFMRGIFVDVSERMRAVEELRQASRLKDDFLAMLAHELRNPLAPISMAAQLLRHPDLSVERARQTGDVIARQVTHMTKLVDDLLDVSRVTRGVIVLKKRPLDLRTVVGTATEQVRPMLDLRGHTLSVELGSRPLLVRGDQTRLTQVVSNLLMNAARYTPKAGQIRLTLNVKGHEVELSLRDNGIGIDQQLLPRVFELFVQGERTPDRAEGGLGLGLALVKGIVELHAGRVGVSSELKKGSEFTVTLPLLFPADAEAEQASPNQVLVKEAVALRLLVVDDNVDAAQTLADFLECAGHRVNIEHDSRAAMVAAARDRPHACILDIGLPGMDGYELARRLRSEPANAGTVLIALTGYGQENDRRLSEAAGFTHHLVKPVQVETLERILGGIVPRS